MYKRFIILVLIFGYAMLFEDILAQKLDVSRQTNIRESGLLQLSKDGILSFKKLQSRFVEYTPNDLFMSLFFGGIPFIPITILRWYNSSSRFIGHLIEDSYIFLDFPYYENANPGRSIIRFFKAYDEYNKHFPGNMLSSKQFALKIIKANEAGWLWSGFEKRFLLPKPTAEISTYVDSLRLGCLDPVVLKKSKDNCFLSGYGLVNMIINAPEPSKLQLINFRLRHQYFNYLLTKEMMSSSAS